MSAAVDQSAQIADKAFALLGSLLVDAGRVWPEVEAAGLTPADFGQHATLAEEVFAGIRKRGPSAFSLLELGGDRRATGQEAVDRCLSPEIAVLHIGDIVEHRKARLMAATFSDMARRAAAGEDPSAISADLLDRLDQIAAPRSFVCMIDAAKWMTADPPAPDSILAELLDRGDKMPIIGPSKCRKTFLAMQAAVALASGRRDFLGWPIHRARRVLFVQLEVRADHFQRRLRRMADAMDVRPDDLGDRLAVINGRGAVPTFAEIERAAKAHRAEIVFLDPLYKLLKGDENSAADVKPTLEAIDRLAERSGAAVAYVHHAAKGRAGDKDTRDRGAGSGVIARDFDAALYISEHKDDGEQGEYFVVRTLARNYASRAAFAVHFHDGKFEIEDTMQAHEKTSFTASHSATVQPADDAVLDLLVDGAMTATLFWQAMSAAGFSRNGGKAAADRLTIAGKLATHRMKTIPPRIMYGTPGQIGALKAEGEQ